MHVSITIERLSLKVEGGTAADARRAVELVIGSITAALLPIASDAPARRTMDDDVRDDLARAARKQAVAGLVEREAAADPDRHSRRKPHERALANASRAAAGDKLHWTQRPENREKVAAMARKRHAKRGRRTAPPAPADDAEPAPAPSTQHPAPSTQHPAPSTQHPAPSTQHPALSTQPSANVTVPPATPGSETRKEDSPVKFRPHQPPLSIGQQRGPAHVTPSAPIPPADIGEARPRFHRDDPDADVLPVNAYLIGGAARLAPPDLTAGEREHRTRLSTACTVAERDVELRPAAKAAPRPYVPAGLAKLVLDALHAHGPQTPPEIARRVARSPQSMAMTLQGLARRRLVIATDEHRRSPHTRGTPARVWTLATSAPAQQPEVTAA